jgi:UDP-N-acetylmuramate dehydrogenase
MHEHHDITHLSGYQTPALARYFVEFRGDNIDELRAVTAFIHQMKLPILVIAGGRNSLLAFDEYPGLVIHNVSEWYNLHHRQLTVSSGQSLWDLAETLETEHGIDLWHRFCGLPGSIGGAVYGNAGCFGLEIGPYITSVEILDMQTGEIFSKTGEEMRFGYRWSECKNHPSWLITSITCDLSQMIEKYPAPAEDPLDWRSRVQPEWLSCGSFFKNPSREQSAGSLLEQAGLKGYRHGGAYFSDKHANFLMSDGTATWTDLVELVELAQKKVAKLSGLSLEPEVRIVYS